METKCDHFVENLMSASDFIKNAVHETIEYWAPDPPPVIILFSALGHELARQFDSLEDRTRARIFNQIEEGMDSKDEQLKTAVATGMIEAIFSEAFKDDQLSQRIKLELGPASVRYVDAWMNADF